MRAPTVALAAVLASAAAQDGPGKGPWQTATPESQGLSAAALEGAEERTNDRIGGRTCFLAVKNGKIVHERYRGSGGESVTRLGYSTTKSHCSALYGIATQQAWADPTDRVDTRNKGTRRCNADAQFRHVLTMSGESNDITNPRFRYDTDGTRCLDTLGDFLDENNPDGLSMEAWKDKYWQDVIGWEHSSWTGARGGLLCGHSSSVSCRDLARAAQLWLNEGSWPGAGQVMSRQHAIDGRRETFPNMGEEYGYTVWLNPDDPVDAEVFSFNGMFSQCAYISKKHEAIVVSMGLGDITGAGCARAWEESRDAMVSGGVRNSTRQVRRKGSRAPVTHAEVLQVRDQVRAGQLRPSSEEIQQLNQYLSEHNETRV